MKKKHHFLRKANLKSFFLGLLVDMYTTPWNCPSPSIWMRLERTLRYRLASKSIILTDNEKRLSDLKNAYLGKRAFIIGNGPSLNQCDLTLLKDEVTFGVNSIFLNESGFCPTYYVVEDVFVAEDRAEQINAYSGPTKFFGNYLRYCLDDAEDTIWLNVIFRYDDYPNFPYFSKNALRKVWTGGTVTYLCLQLAYYMGFDEIYLIGFDHLYQIPSDSEVDGTAIVSRSADPNHFDPNYFGKGYRWHDPRVDRMEQSYQKARKFFKADGRKIYNATVGGNLNVFERVDYYSLFPNE